jgi:hypothetical protein
MAIDYQLAVAAYGAYYSGSRPEDVAPFAGLPQPEKYRWAMVGAAVQKKLAASRVVPIQTPVRDAGQSRMVAEQEKFDREKREEVVRRNAALMGEPDKPVPGQPIAVAPDPGPPANPPAAVRGGKSREIAIEGL